VLDPRRWGVLLAVALLVTIAQPARAATPDPLYEDTEDSLSFPDPLERMNRATFQVNRQLDRFVVEPITDVYTLVLPSSVRQSIRRFLRNLNSPSVVANDLLQREWWDAGVAAARTGINTTVGVAGFFDPASRLGLPHHHSDFGQTLALAGMKSGPYIVLPLLGPSNVRDSLGAIIDFAFRPTTYLFGSSLLAAGLPNFGLTGLSDQFVYSTIQGGSTGLVKRAGAQEEIDALRESSVDYYATLKTAYYQNRVGNIWGRREHHHEIRSRALFIRRCRSSAPRFSRAGARTGRRIRPASSRQCSQSDVVQAR
jgi:phospholipid-binding lipoprotein MlaA